MGKGFECSEYLIGQDLGEIIIRAFERAVKCPQIVWLSFRCTDSSWSVESRSQFSRHCERLLRGPPLPCIS